MSNPISPLPKIQKPMESLGISKIKSIYTDSHDKSSDRFCHYKRSGKSAAGEMAKRNGRHWKLEPFVILK